MTCLIREVLRNHLIFWNKRERMGEGRNWGGGYVSFSFLPTDTHNHFASTAETNLGLKSQLLSHPRKKTEYVLSEASFPWPQIKIFCKQRKRIFRFFQTNNFNFSLSLFPDSSAAVSFWFLFFVSPWPLISNWKKRNQSEIFSFSISLFCCEHGKEKWCRFFSWKIQKNKKNLSLFTQYLYLRPWERSFKQAYFNT